MKNHSDDRINYKTVYSSDGIKMGEVEVAFRLFYCEARKRAKYGDKILL